MRPLIKWIPVLMAVAGIWAGCDRSPKVKLSADALLARKLTGTWARSNLVCVLNADGYSTGSWTNRNGSVVNYQAGWKVENGMLVVTLQDIQSDTTNHEPVGSVDTLKIISVDDTNFVWCGTAPNDTPTPLSRVPDR